MVDKITQPITPLEQIEKINEIIECVAEFGGSGVDKSTTNGILKKQVSESHHPIIENNSVLLYEWLPDIGSKVIYTRTLQLEAGFSIFDENSTPIGEIVSVDNDTQITVTGDVDGSDYTYYGDTIHTRIITLKSGSKLYVGGNIGTITIEEDLDISDAGEMPEGTKDFAIVLYDYNSGVYDTIGGVPVEVLGKSPRDNYMTTVYYELDVPTPNYKPMYSSSYYSATLPICIIRTDGTVEPYIKDVYQIGDACLVFKDSLKVSIPNGRNSDGTLNNLIVSSVDSILTDISGTDKIYINSTGALQKSSNCEYNQKENYNKVDGTDVLYAKIGDISSIDDVIQVATKEDLKSVVNYNNISNCITHIPNDIKLELNNGTLTLKAGSKVYVPNGFEEDGTTPYFDEVITTNDLTLSETQNALREKFVFISQDETQMQTMDVSNTYSGESAPSGSTYMCWYDTKNNLVKTTSNGGSSWTTVSLPIAISHIYSSGFTSIDRVFNGIGYFGSTVYVLPNTKFLIPNGKNEDGSNNNIEYTETEVRLATKTTYESNPDLFFGPFAFYNHTYLGECLTPPAIKNYSLYYNIAENKMYSTGTNGYWSKINNLVYLGRISNYDSRITKAKIRHVFQAVDGNLNRTVVESYQSGSTWYRKYSDGWVEQGGTIDNGSSTHSFSKLVTFPVAFKDTTYCCLSNAIGSNPTQTGFVKTSKTGATFYSTRDGGSATTRYMQWFACGYSG